MRNGPAARGADCWRQKSTKVCRLASITVLAVVAACSSGGHGAATNNSEPTSPAVSVAGQTQTTQDESTPMRAVEQVAGLVVTRFPQPPKNAADPIDWAEIGPQATAALVPVPASEWSVLVQAPFSEGAVFIFDWVDASHFTQLRYSPFIREWWMDELDGGRWTSEKFASEQRPEDTTFAIRRGFDHLTIELTDGNLKTIRRPMSTNTSKVGIRWLAEPKAISQFDLGRIGTSDMRMSSDAADAVEVVLPPPSDPENALNGAIHLGIIPYETVYIDGMPGRSGTLFLPTRQGTRTPVVIVIPGFGAASGSVAWVGPQLASMGIAVFVATVADVDSGPQTRSADFAWLKRVLAADPVVKERIDLRKTFLAGHSMGGGAAFYRAALSTDVAGVIGLAPWLAQPGQETVMNPDTRSLVVSCQADHIATYDEQIAPLLEGFNGSKNLDWYEIANEDHECTSSRQNKDHVRRSIAKFMLDFIERDPTESPTPSGGSSTTSNSSTGSDESQCELIAESGVVSRSSFNCA